MVLFSRTAPCPTPSSLLGHTGAGKAKAKNKAKKKGQKNDPKAKIDDIPPNRRAGKVRRRTRTVERMNLSIQCPFHAPFILGVEVMR